MRRVFFAAVVIITVAHSFHAVPDGDWPAYGRDPGGQRFSPLTTINRNNVRGLKVAWAFHTGDAYQPS
jgi:quinoprotein glucose dehydrogenase